MAQSVVELQGVTVKFGLHERLKNVHLAVGRGEMLAVMGPSGSGKSLLLKVMVGLVSPTAGAVYVDGRALTSAQYSRNRFSQFSDWNAVSAQCTFRFADSH